MFGVHEIEVFPSSALKLFLSNLFKIKEKQQVQGLQVFAFSAVTANDEHRKPRIKIKHTC